MPGYFPDGKCKWHACNRVLRGKPPFTTFEIDFSRRSGKCYWGPQRQGWITNVRVVANDKLYAHYEIRRPYRQREDAVLLTGEMTVEIGGIAVDPTVDPLGPPARLRRHTEAREGTLNIWGATWLWQRDRGYFKIRLVEVIETPASSAYVTFISETGFPHAAVFMEFSSGRRKWVGFNVQSGKGFVQTIGRTSKINHYARFRTSDTRLREAEAMIARKWEKSTYLATVRDCVSFAYDVAEACGLHTPRIVTPVGEWRGESPYGVVRDLAAFNSGQLTHEDEEPYPWKR